MIVSSPSDRKFLLQDSDEDEEQQLFERQALLNQDSRNDNSNLRKRGNRADSDNEFYELKTTKTVNEPPTEYTFYDIQPDDTLQSVCLRYACSPNHVKRINGFMNDQEFFGLRRIKLPLGKLGLLNDILTPDNFLQSSPSLAPGSSFRKSPVNSPGSALSVSRFSIEDLKQTQIQPHHSHSHSFSSMRDFTDHNLTTEINHNQHFQQTQAIAKASSKHQNFIKSNQPIVPDLVTDVDNIEKVFEDLDYHVELAKVAAESYDERAADLVNRIDIISTPASDTIRVSKIPQLFLCSENFGLNYKKLLVFIVVVCIIFPLIGYINQTNVNHALHAKSSIHSLSSQEINHHDTI